MSVLKNVYNVNAPTSNLVTTLTGAVLALVSILNAFGVFTSDQAAALQSQVPALATTIVTIVGIISSLILVFKAKD